MRWIPKKETAISATLADDGLGERLPFDLNWLVVGIVEVGVHVRDLAHHPDIHQVLIKFRVGERASFPT